MNVMLLQVTQRITRSRARMMEAAASKQTDWKVPVRNDKSKRASKQAESNEYHAVQKKVPKKTSNSNTPRRPKRSPSMPRLEPMATPGPSSRTTLTYSQTRQVPIETEPPPTNCIPTEVIAKLNKLDNMHQNTQNLIVQLFQEERTARNQRDQETARQIENFQTETARKNEEFQSQTTRMIVDMQEKNGKEIQAMREELKRLEIANAHYKKMSEKKILELENRLTVAERGEITVGPYKVEAWSRAG